MGDTDTLDSNGKLKDSPVLELTGKIMLSIIMILFFCVSLILFLHLYLKCFSYRRRDQEEEAQAAAVRRRRRRSFDFASGHPAAAAARQRLDPSVLKSIPVLLFSSEDFKNGLECAVCLSEIADGDKTRILPKCNHWFHVDCIDMWFQSNSTCPICRNPVSIQSESTTVSENSSGFPTNVLFWGNQGEISSLNSNSGENRQVLPPNSSQSSPNSFPSSSSSTPDGMLVIDIPRQIDEDDEAKSPVIKHLRSLKRLLSGGRKVNPCSSSDDPEQISTDQS